MIQAWERSANSGIRKHHKWLQRRKISTPEMLGLRKIPGSYNYAPGDYLGMTWLGKGKNQTVLRVDSKIPDMDYIAMYVECVTDPKIGEQIIEHIKFYPDQDLIETTEKDFSILSVISYLRKLNEMHQSLQPLLFPRQPSLVHNQARKTGHGQNITHGHRNQIHSKLQLKFHYTPENQILRTALERADRYVIECLDETTRNMLKPWIDASHAYLGHISPIHIKSRDFDAANKSNKISFYRPLLTLAKAVLNQLGCNPHTELQQNLIPPFSLYSPKLFERYAEMKLRKDSSNIVAPITMIDTDNPGAFNALVQPDFYDSDEKMPRIIDAKYKELNLTKIAREDKYQIIAYSQHRGLLDEMKCKHGSVQLGFAYPLVIDSKKIINNKVSKAFFQDIVIYEIPCPKK